MEIRIFECFQDSLSLIERQNRENLDPLEEEIRDANQRMRVARSIRELIESSIIGIGIRFYEVWLIDAFQPQFRA